MAQTLRPTKFKHVNLDDPFFKSLKDQYAEFSAWFARKLEEPVYVVDDDDDDDGAIRGFLYLKIEDGPIGDVAPPLPSKRRLKVGTLKVEARGTKIGERIIKRIFDHAVAEKALEVYVTVFDTHERLINLFKRYGFIEKGTKKTANGTELVLLKSLEFSSGDIIEDYPRLHTRGRPKWLLAIHPEYHTKLLADSVLRTEDPADEQDVPHSNSIHKVYVAGLALTRMKRGDLVVMYRTTDGKGPARFRSVATSVCVVEETRSRSSFIDEDDFVKFASVNSVFSEPELRARFRDRARKLYVARMTYNVAFAKRPIRGQLLDDVGISELPYWQLRELSDTQFSRILELGKVNESIIID